MARKRNAQGTSILALLEALRARRESDEYASEFPQKIRPASPITKGIPTLKRGVHRRPTPMIRQRFEFCGAWKGAFIGLEWLSVSGMRSALRNKEIMHQIRGRRDYCEGSAPAIYDWDSLSLFAVDRLDKDEIYLVWDEDERKEPKVVWYFAQSESEFANLKEYLEYLLKPRKRKGRKGDSKRKSRS